MGWWKNPFKAESYKEVLKNSGPAVSLFGAATGQPWISAIGAGINAYESGDQSKKDAKKANKQSFDLDHANYMRQKEFAKYGVRWRAEDARAAGLSPLAALGGSFQSYSNTVGGGGYESARPDYAAVAAQLGQDLSRAAQAKATAQERASVARDTAEYQRLQLDNLNLQNQGAYLDNMYKLSRIVRLREGIPPAMPAVNGAYSAGSAAQGSVVAQPATPTVGSPGEPQRAPGAIPDWQWAETDNGRIRVPTPDMKNAMEDDLLLEMDWFIRNRFNPWFREAQQRKEDWWAKHRRVGGYQP